MVSILLLILKIVGILLLFVLGLLLTVLILLLTVPIRYRGQASFHGKFLFDAKVSWLLHLLSLNVAYDEELSYSARILGFRILSSEADAAYEEELADVPMESAPMEAENPAEEGQTEQKRDLTAPEKIHGQEKAVLPGKVLTERPREPLGHRLIKRIRSFFQSIGRKIRLLAEKRQMILDFLRDENNQKTIRLIWKQVKRLLRHLLPTRVDVDVTLGFDDPATMGKVLSYLSIPQAFYGDHISVTPVFDRDMKDGDGRIKGRIRLGTVALCGIRIFLDRNFRVLLKKWRTYGG